MLELLAPQIEQFSRVEPVANAVPTQDADTLYQLRAYLDSHFLEEHSMARLSHYCGLKSRKALSFSLTPPFLIICVVQPLDDAGRLLRDSSSLVGEVVQTVGYEQAHPFAVAFKKYTGLLPSGYKQE